MPFVVPATDQRSCAVVTSSQSEAGQRLPQPASRKGKEALKETAAAAATRALPPPPRRPERAISPPPKQQQCAEECAIAAYLAAHPHGPLPVLLMCRCKGRQRSSKQQQQLQQLQQQQQRLPHSHTGASVVRLVEPSTSSDASTSASTTAGPRGSASPTVTVPSSRPLHPSPPPRQRPPHPKQPPPMTSVFPTTTSASSASSSSASSSSTSLPPAAQFHTATTVGVAPSSPSYNRHSGAIRYLGGSVSAQSCRQPPSPLPATAPAAAAAAAAAAAVAPSIRTSASSPGAAVPAAPTTASTASDYFALLGGPIPTHLMALQQHPDLASELSARPNSLYKAAPPSGVSHPAMFHDASHRATAFGASPPERHQRPAPPPSPQLPILPIIPQTFYVAPVLPGKRASTWAKRPSSSVMGPPLPHTAAHAEVPSKAAGPSSAPSPSPAAPVHPRHSPIHENPFQATAEQTEVLASAEPNPPPPAAPLSPPPQSEHRTDSLSLTKAPAAQSGRTTPQRDPQNGGFRCAEKSLRKKKQAKVTGPLNGLPRQNSKLNATLSHLDRLQKGVREAHHRRLRQKSGSLPTTATVRSFALLYNECSVRTVSQWVATNAPHGRATARENPSASNFLPTAPAQFRKCNHCGRFGHYEVLCPALPPEYAAAIEYDLARPSTPPPRPRQPPPPPPRPTSASKTSGEKSRKVSIELCEGFLFEQSNKLQSSAKRPRKGPLQSNDTTSNSGSYRNPLLESTQLDLLVVEAAAHVRLLV